MKHTVGEREPERLLCPVRAIIAYKSRTPDGPYPASDSVLLRHPKPTIKVTKGHIATWVTEAVKIAYAAATEKPDSVHCNAHEGRAVAHSLVAFSGASLEDVMEGGKWSSSSSFFRHYLRDMSTTSTAKSTKVVAGGRLLGDH